MDVKVSHTGAYAPVDSTLDRISAFDPRTGDHLWCIQLVYRVDPAKDDADGPGILDQENLIQISPALCYHCVRPYTPKLGTRRCPGKPA